MNASNAKDYLPLVQALSEGRTLQYKTIMPPEWVDIETTDVDFVLGPDRYRIKPEPREIWVNHYANPCMLDQVCDSKEEADQRCIRGELVCQICYREVIE